MTDKRVTVRKTGIVFIAAGTALLLLALGLLCRSRAEDIRAGQQAEYLLSVIRAASAAKQQDGSGQILPKADEDGEADALPELPTAIIDGYGYIGQLALPTLQLTLPVMSDWDYDRLKIAPCRQFGWPCTDDLVIAAHNYPSHFGRLDRLAKGDSVIFTDMDGQETGYSVREICIIPPTQAASVFDSGFDLVLYTCTYGGENRVAVFCDRVGDTN